MKKILTRIASVVLAMCIILSFAIVSVSATDVVPDIVKTDYVPVDDGNFITTYPTNFVDINSGEVGCSVSGSIVTMTANSTVGTSSDWGMQGFEINERFISTLTDGVAPVFTQSTKVIIGAKVRKAADATADAKINASFSSWYKVQYEEGSPIYTDNYPNAGDGFDVTSTEWTDFKAVMTVPNNGDGNTWAFLLGLASGTAQGAKVEVDMSSIYLGAEMTYDINVSMAKTIGAGETTTAKATIVNQLGEAYGAQGGFTWYALNSERTEIASGISVTDNGNGEATVSVSETVQAGTYDIVAVSDTYEGFVKGAEITVANAKLDYVPGDDGNLVTTYPTNFVDINSGEVGCAVSGSTVTMTANSTVATSNDWGMQGFEINERFIPTLSDGHVPVYTEPTKVLIGAKVRKAADATADAKINVSLSSWYKVAYENGKPIYSDNYPAAGEGFLVDSYEWTDFSAVITAPTTGDGNTWAFLLGLAEGTEAGAKVEVDMTSIFLGTEKAYDIKVAADTDTVNAEAGAEVTVSANIVNQLGDAFSGGQGGFAWSAMTTDRTAEAEGITVTDNGNGTAKVSFDPSVATGTYDIVATSDTYVGFTRGVEITVENIKNIVDYIPGVDGNLVKMFPEQYVDINSGVSCTVSGTNVVMAANATVGTSSDWGMQGFEINERFIPALVDGVSPEFAQGTKVLFSAKVRKAADATADAKINTSFSSWYAAAYENFNPIYSDNYPAAGEGFLVDSYDWTEFSVVMTMPKNCGGNTWAYLLGLAEGTEAGAKVEVDMTSIYFGTESAYDIAVSLDKDAVDAGDSFTATADIVNQIGLPYSGNQGGFKWYAMNVSRTAVVSGISVNDNGNGTASVTVADTVTDGTYYIVAISDTYDNFARGAKFNVGSTISGITLSEFGGKVTVATDTDLTNAYLLFASYGNNDEMVDLEIVPVTLAAQSSGEYAPTNLLAGRYTKAMLWSDFAACTPLANMIKY